MQSRIKELLISSSFLFDLKSDAFKERHWRALWNQAKVKADYNPSSLNLRTIFDIGLKRNENILKELLSKAAAEVCVCSFE